MSFFERRQGSRFAEDVSLTAIANQFGTPCYVYSKAAFSAHFLAYYEADIPQQTLVCYAVKANSNIAVLKVLAQLGAGFDIVSAGELHRVLAAGGDPQKVVFSGVGKQPAEMVMALKANIHCFNVESAEELVVLNRVAGEMGKIAPVSLRVNPDVDAQTHPYISTGLKDNKFGIDIEKAPEVYSQAHAMANIDVKGVDCHIGSQLTELSPFLDALERVLALIDQLSARGISIEHIDIGGGLGVCYQNEIPPDPKDYLQQVSQRLGDRALSIIVEPGRSIAANAGVFLTRVDYLKHNDYKNFAIVDGAMNDMIRPALYGAWMNIDLVEQGQESDNSGALKSYDIVGPVCETGDFLGKDRQLPLNSGDLLCLHSAGAYGFTMSSNYNSRGRAAEIMVDGSNAHLVRERENLDDLIRGEQVLPS